MRFARKYSDSNKTFPDAESWLIFNNWQHTFYVRLRVPLLVDLFPMWALMYTGAFHE